MAATASPYGFKAVNELGGLPYAGSTRSFLIDPAGYSNNIFNGSIVFVGSDGYLQLAPATGADWLSDRLVYWPRTTTLEAFAEPTVTS